MGVSIYPVLERDVPGVDATTVDGKALARAVYAETDTASTRLQKFISLDVGEMLDEGFAPHPDEWYDVTEGLAAVRAALSETQEAQVKADLTEVERVLLLAQEHGARFHFLIDF